MTLCRQYTPVCCWMQHLFWEIRFRAASAAAIILPKNLGLWGIIGCIFLVHSNHDICTDLSFHLKPMLTESSHKLSIGWDSDPKKTRSSNWRLYLRTTILCYLPAARLDFPQMPLSRCTAVHHIRRLQESEFGSWHHYIHQSAIHREETLYFWRCCCCDEKCIVCNRFRPHLLEQRRVTSPQVAWTHSHPYRSETVWIR